MDGGRREVYVERFIGGGLTDNNNNIWLKRIPKKNTKSNWMSFLNKHSGKKAERKDRMTKHTHTHTQ